eukprot:CAMPEP_0116005464 /NCGR_PEP_ID=MMETSP0321-20121206/1178_1 /TAXON_ID=163516 /ORGANISM="Leptocylindrus danicus var. danicus, Strain B650" /LENGTH=249 /DNA_ID=CAMNT_0003473891 /DNA_START=222 /DNA_END=971 /DNA_ORIENTATION=-
MASAGQQLTSLAEKWPHADAIRYEHKNVKWSFREVDHFAESLASGLLETGFAPGDSIVSWLPSHVAEQHVLQFACAKAGFVLYSLDPAQAVDDPDGACDALAKALTETNAVALFSLETGNDVNYLRLCKKVIPETRMFDFASGEQFFTPRFPNLRMPIHTGFDRMGDKYGFVLYKHLLAPNGATPALLADAAISEKTPLCGELVTGKDGTLSKGKVLTSDEVVKGKVWSEFSSILEKKFIEVPGVGVIF